MLSAPAEGGVSQRLGRGRPLAAGFPDWRAGRFSVYFGNLI